MSALVAPILSLRGVGKRFENGTMALSGIDLEVAEGSFVSLLGPSGCGKSTLLRLIAGLGQPSAGTIAWAGAAKPDIGFVFQEPTLMPWKRVIDNVMLPLRLRSVARAEAEARAAAMLALVGLAGFERDYPRQLSGGMKMRVSIARALVTRPAVLLMDEPFAALDEITRQRLNDDLIGLWLAQRFTAIFVTHSVFESVYLAQRIVTMAARPGRLMADQPGIAGYPRSADFRTSAEYALSCRAVSDALKQAMAVDTMAGIAA